MSRSCLALFFRVIAFASLASTVRADGVDDYLKRQMARNHIPGSAVAIVRNGQVVKLQAYGSANLEWDAPATPNTAFQLASATKLLTGTALMALVEQGRIGLDDPVSKYLPDAPPAWREVTIGRLASHQSGLKMLDLNTAYPTTGDAVKALAALPLEYPPGTRQMYVSSDYTVLMDVVERVTGKPFDAFLRERLFAPLEMSGARFDHARNDGLFRSADVVPHRTTNYEWDDATRAQRVFWMVFPEWTYPAGGLYASAADLAKWAAALDGDKLLSAESKRTMWAPRPLTGGKPGAYGIGWSVGTYRGRRAVGHSGGPALADILHFPDDRLTIVVLTNQQKLYPHFAQGVADLFVPEPPASADKGIADDDEPTTRRLRGVLADAAGGKVDADLFAPAAREQFVPAFTGFAPLYFGGLDPLQSFVLLEDRREDGSRTRRYRARFGSKSIVWTFVLDGEGKIVAMEPRTE